jgi:protein-L-isoaspartate(D-aspartate) O-methyltransferase
MLAILLCRDNRSAALCPWRPSQLVAIAALVTRTASGLELRPLTPAWFIPCIGASGEPAGSTAPDGAAAWQSRSIRLTAEEAPDQSATAVYQDVWFSSQPTPQ